MIERMGFVAAVLAACAPRAGSPPPPPGQPPAAGGTERPAEPPVIVAVPPPESDEEPRETPAAPIELAAASGWATFHGDSGRTGVSSAVAVTKPRIVWKAKVGVQSWLNSPLALGKTLVIVPSSGNAHNQPDPNDGVFALDFASGKKLWHAHFDQDANGAAASKERVFATSDDGHLYAIEIKTGKIAWKQQGKGKMYTHPLLVDARVVVGDATGYVRAYAASDGKPAWSLQLTGAIRGGASADDRQIYVASQGGEVAALGRDGKVVWKSIVKRPPWSGQGKDEPIEVYSPPIVTKDLVILPFSRDTYYTDQPALIALDKTSGKVKWKAKGPGEWGNVRSTPALVGGMLVYSEPYSGDVVGINAASGRMTYRKTIGPCYFPQWSSPAVAGDLVYLPRFDGSVYAIRSASGKLEWEMYLGEASIAGKPGPAGAKNKQSCGWTVAKGHSIYSPAAIAEDGRLFVGTGEGFLYAIGA